MKIQIPRTKNTIDCRYCGVPNDIYFSISLERVKDLVQCLEDLVKTNHKIITRIDVLEKLIVDKMKREEVKL